MTETPTGPGQADGPAVPAWSRPRTVSGSGAWPGGPLPPGPPAPPEPAEPAEPIEPISPAEPPRPRRVAVAVLSVLLVVTLGAGAWLTWYLLQVNDAWQEHTERWQSLAEQHGAELGQTRAELEATRTELASAQDQLTTAQERITQLADEKAQLGDESAAQQQLADYQARVSRAAGDVATALATCIDGQEQLIGYLAEPDKWDQTQLAAYRTDVEQYCRDARDANAALQTELSR